MMAPARIHFVERAKFIDAIFAKQVAGELLDPGTFGRAGLGLCQTLAQESGGFSEVRSPGGLSNRPSGLEVLNPKRASVGPAVD
jgi:hypothetical protein